MKNLAIGSVIIVLTVVSLTTYFNNRTVKDIGQDGMKLTSEGAWIIRHKQ